MAKGVSDSKEQKKPVIEKASKSLVKAFGEKYGFRAEMPSVQLKEAMGMLKQDHTQLADESFDAQFEDEAKLLNKKIREYGMDDGKGKVPEPVKRAIENLEKAVDAAVGDKATEEERLATKKVKVYEVIQETKAPLDVEAPAKAAPKPHAQHEGMQKAMKAVDASKKGGRAQQQEEAPAEEESYDVKPPTTPKGQGAGKEAPQGQGGQQGGGARRPATTRR